MPSDLKTHLAAHLKQHHPRLSPSNAAKIIDKLVEEITSGVGRWWPDEPEMIGLTLQLEKKRADLFKPVPSVEALTAHLAKKRNITTPVERLKLQREVEALSDDQRLEMLGEDKVEEPKQVAQERRPAAVNTPPMEDIAHLNPVARLAAARRIAAGNAQKAPAAKPDRPMTPIERINASRGL